MTNNEGHPGLTSKRVLVNMPAAKATKAYKFARPFHGPYRSVEQSNTRVMGCPIGKPQAEPIRVLVT